MVVKKLQFLESFEVHHCDIDDDHRQIIALLNSIVDETSIGSFDRLVQKLDQFVAFFGAHCRREEAVLRDVEFPGFEDHKDEHDRICLRLTRELEHIKVAESLSAAEAFVRAMPELLVHEIIKVDTRFKSHLIEKLGIQARRSVAKNYDLAPRYVTEER